MSTARPEAPVGYLALLRGNRNFRNVWLGEIVSLLGDWFNLVASASLIGALTGSGLAVGGLFVVRMLAPFLVSPLAGVMADRHSRKRIMIVTDLARVVVVLGFLLVRSPGQLWLLYTLTALQLALGGFFAPARSALLPDIVSARELGAANALSSGTYAVMQALGAALGGVVSGAWGVYQTFVVDAASFLVSALLCWRIDAPAIGAARVRTVAALVRQYLDGLRYLRRDLDTLFIVLHKGANCLLITGGLNVLLVSIAQDRFPVGDGGRISIGLAFCATGLGTAVGPLLAHRLTGDRAGRLRLGLVLCYLVTAAGLALAAPLASLALVLVGVFVRGVGGGMLFLFSTQLLMQRVPAGVRGRVFSTEIALRSLMSAAGTAAVSAGMDTALGMGGMLWLMAALALLPGGLWFVWLLRGQTGAKEESLATG